MAAVPGACAQALAKKGPQWCESPDEVVAIGSAIQAGVFRRGQGCPALDVTPLSLGIETLGCVFTKLIDTNTTMPTRRPGFLTPGQSDAVTIRVFQRARDGIRQQAAGHLINRHTARAARNPQSKCTFSPIDANGIATFMEKTRTTGAVD